MAHKKSLEALNRPLQDLKESSQLMGETLVVLAGDFRQTLTVIHRSTPADELNACLKSSALWIKVQKLQLSTNMRIRIHQGKMHNNSQRNCGRLAAALSPVIHRQAKSHSMKFVPVSVVH